MINEKEKELIEYMDYQVMNNGIDGWLGNRGYEKLHDFIQILYKRNKEIDQKVAAIFIKATSAGLGKYQHKTASVIPAIGELYIQYETELEQCKEQYWQISKSFMNSYGLEDFDTRFPYK